MSNETQVTIRQATAAYENFLNRGGSAEDGDIMSRFFDQYHALEADLALALSALREIAESYVEYDLSRLSATEVNRIATATLDAIEQRHGRQGA